MGTENQRPSRQELKRLAAINRGEPLQGLRVMNERAKAALKDHPNVVVGLTPTDFDPRKDIPESLCSIHEGLNLSMYEYGSDSFMNLLSQAYGLGLDEIPKADVIKESMTRSNGKSSIELLETGNVDEIILYRKNDREKLEKEFPEQILNQNFYQFLQDTYGIPNRKQAEIFFYQNITEASKFINWYIDKTLPQDKNELSQRNEIDPPPERPAKLLHFLASENVSRELKFETQRVLNAFFLSSEFTSRQWDIKLRTKLNALNDGLDEYMFKGLVGSTAPTIITALHNSDTGRVISLLTASTPDEGVIKQHRLKTRPLLEQISSGTDKKSNTHEEKDEDRIYIDFDEKSSYSAMAKALHKAAQRRSKGGGGELIPVRDAIDLCRLVMVTTDTDKTKRDSLVKRFISVLQNPHAAEYFKGLDSIKKDDSTNNKGSSKKFEYRRLQVKFHDLELPIEVQFYDIQSYLNSQLSVGKKAKSRYDGEAHQLYEHGKLVELWEIFFPQSIYGDFKKPLENQQDTIAETLKRRTLTTRGA